MFKFIKNYKSNNTNRIFKSDKNNLPIDCFDEYTFRVRRNLILFAITSIFFKINDIKIKAINSLGITLESIDDKIAKNIELFLLLILAYHITHFTLLSIEHWIYHIKIRVTGNSKNTFHGMRLGEQEVPDKRRSNLYKILGGTGIDSLNKLELNHPENINKLCEQILEEITKLCNEHKLQINNFLKDDKNICDILKKEISERYNSLNNELKNKFFSSSSALETIRMNHNYITQFYQDENFLKKLINRFEKFDNHWKIFGRLQILRWIIIEYSVPFIIGVYGIFLLLRS